MLHVDVERFEQFVGEAIDTIPDPLMRLVDNVVILVEDEDDDPHLLGVYEGVPLTERGHDYMGNHLVPDTITVFRLPILRLCATPEQVIHEVRTTVVHEIAHHFGIDDDRLHELGWG